MNWLLPPDITECSRPVRRAFLLTLPMSGAIWITWALAGMSIMAVGVMLCVAIVILAWIICPPIWAAWKAFELLRDLWSKP